MKPDEDGEAVRTIEDFLARSGASEATNRTTGSQLRSMESWIAARHAGRRIPLGEVSKNDLEALKADLYRRRSGAHYAAIARMFFRVAGREDAMKVLKLRQKGRTRLSPDAILTVADVNALIAAADSARDRALIVVLWETGARAHEAMALNLENVRVLENGNGGQYHLWFRKVKVSGEEHVGYIVEGSAYLKAWIAAHPDPRPDAPLFVSFSGRRFTPHGAAIMVRRTAARAKIGKRVHPHLFRHSRATHLLRVGVPESSVKKLFGWTPGSTMLSRYAHLTGDDARRDLLRAMGLEDDTPVPVERIESDVAKLRPVVAMNAPPPPSPASVGEIMDLMADPKVQHFLSLLRTAGPQSPA